LAAPPAASSNSVAALPKSATDETKVPHYFGPYSNYANSPYSVGDATVTIGGDGSGAMATATVGANGAVTGITITNPGSGYTVAPVTIGGSGNGATANATIGSTGSVTAVAVNAAGAGYTAPSLAASVGLLGLAPSAACVAAEGEQAASKRPISKRTIQAFFIFILSIDRNDALP
jgi:hypothetical protein